LDETLDLVKDCLTCAGERDIYTGDSVDLFIVTKDGVRQERMELKKD
jgi:20S proteasome subunit beta 6